MINPLDTNKENFCETKDNKFYFLLKNEYKDSSNKIFIYGFGKNDISYKVFYMNNTVYYSKNLWNLEINENKKEKKFNSYLSPNLKTNEDFILILIESNSKEEENLIIISRLYSQINPLYIGIYSYQLFHLSETTIKKFSLIENPSIEYKIIINNTEGKGIICFNKICDDKYSFRWTKSLFLFNFKLKKVFNLCSK